MLQCVAVCCSALQCAASCCSVLQCVAVCCSMLQCVAVCCSVLQCVALWHKCDTARHSRLSILSDRDAVCCSMLQFVAVCCNRVPMILQISHATHKMSNVTHIPGENDQARFHLDFTLDGIISFNVLQHVAACCSVLQCAVVMLQCVAVCCSVL